MNWLDLLLLVSAVSFGVSGYRQGFVVGVLSFAGFLGGGVVGLLLAPRLVGHLQTGARQSVLAIGVVLLCATLGQIGATWVGGWVRDRITWHPARVIDSGLGALLSVLAMLLVTWFLASSLRPGPSPTLSRLISESRIVTTVDHVVPDQAATLFSSFRRLLDDRGLPTVFGGLSAERIRPVSPPDSTVTTTAAVRAARASIVKVEGTARSCSRQLEGSGFVYAPHHVITNAHVVAGVRQPTVRVGGSGDKLAARVVLYDSRRDIAVLYVPDLRAAALSFSTAAKRGSTAVVAGFPGGGPFHVEPARVRDVIQARGPDIYQRTQVTREVYSLYADVEPGNSGGPLLTPQGRVYGVVFAKSLDDPRTGYALTAKSVQPDAAAGRASTSGVSTGGCA
jgi:S1-C subfamily serine protease